MDRHACEEMTQHMHKLMEIFLKLMEIFLKDEEDISRRQVKTIRTSKKTQGKH